ncbi:hypothetical protein E4T80_05620 [Muribacter muris]|uniref:DUF5374 domain-containing protein n=1 Tax=Muribacter muris TaxID=67855 RepID=A0A4Y9K2B9_9PAST|nr:DUF5374 domain-containing protein [Muribacter muris]MBF0784947.1 DUF5374 domain-containing protein [Muribacter muris]MBF0827255.1 DUF5374 domain-containing protein [Muribacter muris]TFV10865.1 hypothetical protein E4T80_05620 [Muribacter muris]
MRNLIKAETFISLLTAIVLFSLIILMYMKWQAEQLNQNLFLFQKKQALQIAENQIALKMAGVSCDNQISQNNISFRVLCTEQGVKVSFPLGEIVIGKVK